MAQIPAYQLSIFFSKSIVKGLLIGGLLLSIALVILFGAKPFYERTNIKKTKMTLIQIQMINDAWKRYCNEFGACCSPEMQNKNFSWGNISPEKLSHMLGDRLKKGEVEATLRDGWGHPLQFGVRCQGDREDIIGIRSAGKGGRWDAERYLEGPFSRSDFDRDLVKGNGQWITWPMGSSGGDANIPILDPVHSSSSSIVFPNDR